MALSPRIDYSCGCSASGGLMPLPTRCPVHGDRDRLRDAAPDLLAACREIVAFHDYAFGGYPLTLNGEPIDHTRLNEAARLAQIAIEKAEGGLAREGV